MQVTNQTTNDYWFGPLHLPAGVGQQITVDDTSATSLYLTSDSVADAINNLYNSGKVTVSSAAAPFPRATGVPSLLHGDGSPEGLVFAAQGSLYMRRDGTGGSFLYAKTTGITFDTGWQVYSFQATPIAVIDLANWPPASPSDGQQAILRLPSSYDPVGGKKLCWTFCYDSAAAMWDFMGGPPLYAEVQTAEASASGSYVALTTPGPSVSLPRAGDYQIEPGFTGSGGVAGQTSFMSYDIAGTGAVDADCATADAGTTGSAVLRPREKTGLTAVTITAKYRTTGGVTATFKNRWLRILPVRIS
jgi:hypothetical protein